MWKYCESATHARRRVCLIYAETDAETVFTPETPRRTPRHFKRRRDGHRDKGFCDTISMPN